MVLETIRVNGKHRYCIFETIKGQKSNLIAYYDTLEQAAMVMRYIKGAPMQPKDQQTALRYIFEWDAMESMKMTENL